MEIKTVEIQEVGPYLKELVSLVETGAEIVLTQGNMPVARLVPIARSSAQTRVAGMHEGSMWTSEDFDEPLPEMFWTGEK